MDPRKDQETQKTVETGSPSDLASLIAKVWRAGKGLAADRPPCQEDQKAPLRRSEFSYRIVWIRCRIGCDLIVKDRKVLEVDGLSLL